MPRPNYTHITVECQGSRPEVLNDATRIRSVLRRAADACSLHIVQEGLYRFRPQGITGYVLLAESHISIHTWPEHRFALVDVLSCAPLDVDSLLACLKEALLPRTIGVTTDTRKRSSHEKLPSSSRSGKRSDAQASSAQRIAGTSNGRLSPPKRKLAIAQPTTNRD